MAVINDIGDSGFSVPPPDVVHALEYYYTFTSSNGLTVTMLRDENPPQNKGGVGGWEVVDRRRRMALTTWKGRDPRGMSLPVLFDGWYLDRPPKSVDIDVSILEMMAIGDNFVEPPTVKIDGLLPAYGVTWIINDLDWGTNVVYIRDASNQFIRVRQDCVVTLLQFVDEDVVKVLNKNPLPTTYTTKPGDTLRSIAKETLGSASKWRKIRDANPGLRDPNNVPPNIKIIIPS